MWVPCSPLDTTPSSTVHLSKVALAFYNTIAKIPSLQLCPEKTCRGNSAESVLKPREMKVTSHFRDQPYFIGSRTVFFYSGTSISLPNRYNETMECVSIP